MPEHDVTFDCMGCEVRLLVGDPGPDEPPAAQAAAEAEAWLHEFDAALSRFKPESELVALNDDPREVVPASPLLRAAVAAGRWAAERSGGLVDPTSVLGALEAAGYAESRAGLEPPSLAEALAVAPPRHPAAPNPASRWREVQADEAAGAVRRPPGVRIDTGGTGKGLAADALAVRFAGRSRFAIDCAGDLRVGGHDAGRRPYDIQALHPLTGEAMRTIRIGSGAVATSGIDSRLWRTPQGFAHHVIDPATGEPAWTGLISVTALAPTALEAETLTKTALLSGPEGARTVLAEHGGLIVRDDGDVEPVGSVPGPPPRLRVRMPAAPGR
jgi:FAD:protein FMN transferase